jgi:hypothetical protein
VSRSGRVGRPSGRIDKGLSWLRTTPLDLDAASHRCHYPNLGENLNQEKLPAAFNSVGSSVEGEVKGIYFEGSFTYKEHEVIQIK